MTWWAGLIIGLAIGLIAFALTIIIMIIKKKFFRSESEPQSDSDWNLVNEKVVKVITKIDDIKQEMANWNNTKIQQLNRLGVNVEINKKNTNTINDNVHDLMNIFLNIKQRGSLGEFQLYQILEDLFSTEQKVWEKQFKLPTGGVVDAIIHTAPTAEDIAIDAKFPLVNYQKFLKADNELDRNQFKALFKKDINDKIKEVTKYIDIKNNISNVIIYIPSESIGNFVYNEFSEIIKTSINSNVSICSPSTFITLIHIILKWQADYKLSQSLQSLKIEIKKLGKQYLTFQERWEQMKQDLFKRLIEDIKKIDITVGKIIKKTDQINRFEFETNQTEENK